MNARVANGILGTAVLMLTVFLSQHLNAQITNATLSGTVTDTSGAGMPKVKISVKNVATGQSQTAETNADGVYSLQGLTPGEYEVLITAEGFAGKTIRTTVTEGAPATLNATLTAKQAEPQAPAGNLPNAPSSSTAPSLSDLGLTPEQTQGNPREQALLDKRTHMLKIHQRMGLITTIPLIATVILGPGAGGKSEGTANRDLHVALGALTGDLYGITAWYAIRAPRIKDTPKRGPIRFHEAMAWIHGPGMVLTPILGAMAFEQKNNGEKVHGIAQAHGPVAIVTAGAFGAALLSVSVKF